jgi:hypothetical protein
VIPDFDNLGNLPPGIHSATWPDIQARFGVGLCRQGLLVGLRRALLLLARVGCDTACLVGSFVTNNIFPDDFVVCWDISNVDISRLQLEEPVVLDFSNSREAQKVKFGGQLLPVQLLPAGTRSIFLDFFQRDKSTGDPKGIIAIDLRKV